MYELIQGLAELAGPLRLELLGRLILATLLGGLVGIERERAGKAAGFRTNILICVGATLLTDLSTHLSQSVDAATVQADPARLAAQIVSGIGFLGAGTIIQSRGSVTGLTTAATLWVVAAIGIAVGAGAYVEALGTTALVIVSLFVLGHLQKNLLSSASGEIEVTLESASSLEPVRSVLAEAGIDVMEVDVRDDGARRTARYRASGRADTWLTLPDRLLDLEPVVRVTQH